MRETLLNIFVIMAFESVRVCFVGVWKRIPMSLTSFLLHFKRPKINWC